jgi:branched-subunit amino acid aminotransferase/4-amino-4-deoxychorismate lyase
MNESLHIVEPAAFVAHVQTRRRPFHENYYAMYSSVWDAIVTDPVLMLIPLDDHVVHRGDGVFEAFKCIGGGIYNMEAHLQRLAHSCSALALALPWPLPRIAQIVVETLRAGGRRDCYVRIFLSRGSGSFGVNPYDCPVPHLHVVVTRLDPPFMDKHPSGARVKTSAIAVKPGFLASVKTCNYLPNVLMKKEAVDAGVDFVAGYDERGFLAEGATENFGIVTADGALLFPRLDRILPGTTMLRVVELAGALVAGGSLSRVGFEDIAPESLRAASEVLVVGTTPNVSAVCEYDGQRVADGRPGPICRKLGDLLLADMHGNSARLTPVGL